MLLFVDNTTINSEPDNRVKGLSEINYMRVYKNFSRRVYAVGNWKIYFLEVF